MIMDGIKIGQIHKGDVWSPELMTLSYEQAARDIFPFLGSLGLIDSELNKLTRFNQRSRDNRPQAMVGDADRDDELRE